MTQPSGRGPSTPEAPEAQASAGAAPVQRKEEAESGVFNSGIPTAQRSRSLGESGSLPGAGWLYPPTTQWAFQTRTQPRGTEQRLMAPGLSALLRHCPAQVPPLWPHFLGTSCVSLYFSCSLKDYNYLHFTDEETGVLRPAKSPRRLGAWTGSTCLSTSMPGLRPQRERPRSMPGPSLGTEVAPPTRSSAMHSTLFSLCLTTYCLVHD